jgi:hypothetical protein
MILKLPSNEDITLFRTADDSDTPFAAPGLSESLKRGNNVRAGEEPRLDILQQPQSS